MYAAMYDAEFGPLVGAAALRCKDAPDMTSPTCHPNSNAMVGPPKRSAFEERHCYQPSHFEVAVVYSGSYRSRLFFHVRLQQSPFQSIPQSTASTS